MGWAKIHIQSPGVTLIVLLFIAKKYLLGFLSCMFDALYNIHTFQSLLLEKCRHDLNFLLAQLI